MLEEVLQVMDHHESPSPPPPPAAPATNTTTTNTTPDSDTPQCIACGDTIQGLVLNLKCKHNYDVGCLVDMFLANLSSQVFPPVCCKTAIPLSLIKPHVSEDVGKMMEDKERELRTTDRLYCASPTCSRFLGSRQLQDPSPASTSVSCSACNTKTCARCRGPAHGTGLKGSTKRCKVDKELKKALLLGQSRGWQRCPQCRAVVERTSGCRHISCPCGTHFCYGCGGLMGACTCGRKQKKDYLLGEEPMLTLSFGKAGSGSMLVRICKKSWTGVRGIVGGKKR